MYTSEFRSIIRKIDGDTIHEIQLRQTNDGREVNRQFYARRDERGAHEWIRGKNQNSSDWIVTNGIETKTHHLDTYTPWFRSVASEMRSLTGPDVLVRSLLSIDIDRFDHPFFRSPPLNDSLCEIDTDEFATKKT